MSEQLDLDFDPRPPRELDHPDLAVVAWITQSDLPISARVDARHELGWWAGLPNYERSRYRAMYEHERGLDDGRLRPFSVVNRWYTVDPEVVRMDEESVQRWAADIRDAALHGRPMPYAESEGMTGTERLWFRARLQSACLLAGAFIIEAAPPPEKKTRRKAA